MNCVKHPRDVGLSTCEKCKSAICYKCLNLIYFSGNIISLCFDCSIKFHSKKIKILKQKKKYYGIDLVKMLISFIIIIILIYLDIFYNDGKIFFSVSLFDFFILSPIITGLRSFPINYEFSKYNRGNIFLSIICFPYYFFVDIYGFCVLYYLTGLVTPLYFPVDIIKYFYLKSLVKKI